ncbi:MAG TPA: MlaD family protein [Kofleriaceae bacterium]|nr:MlaD family protein [Kofleriaceae bacterium]
MTQVTRAQKVRLGIFLAAGLTVLVGGVVILAGAKLVEGRDDYVVRFRDSGVSLNGLDVGSPVKYSGIRVGRVDAVKIDPDDVSIILVELSLDEDTPVAEDSVANLGSQGITGLKYIELSRGSSKARVREPGEEIPPGSSMFDNLTQKADQIASKVEVVLDRVAVLAGPDMKDRLASLLDTTDQFLATLNGVLEDNRESLKTLAVQVSGTSEQVKLLATELATTAKRANALLAEATIVVKNARATPEQVNAFLEQGTAVLAESRVLLGPEGLQRTLARVNAIMAQTQHQVIETIGLFREAAENANAFTEKVRDDPSLLLLGGRDEDEP